MSNEEVALSCLLQDWYSASVLHKGDAEPIFQRFKEEAVTYPKLRELAQSKLNELDALKSQCNGSLSERCFVSQTSHQFLERALRT